MKISPTLLDTFDANVGRWGVDQIIGALEKHFAGHKIADPETKH